MELSAKDMSAANRGCKLNSIFDFGQNVICIERFKTITMDKIEISAIRNTCKAYIFSPIKSYIIPANMWDALLAADCIQALDFSRNEVQSISIATFSSLAGKKLHSKTDSQ